MGFFRRFSDAMNEEFVIGQRNVERYEADPDTLDEILAEQRARGLGSARGLRQARRAQAAAAGTERRSGFVEGVAQVALAAGIGLLVAELWNGRGERD